MANLQRNEELLLEIRSFLLQVLAGQAAQAEMNLMLKNLKASHDAMCSEMRSNYVGFEGWARELAKDNK